MAPDDERPRAVKVKLCLAGEPAVGKSSMIKRFVLDMYDDRYIATLGTKVTKKTVTLVDFDGGQVKADLIVWDVMGTRSIRDLLKEAYYHGANGVMAVCDLTRRETLLELDSWSKAIETVAGVVPTQVVANKVDLKESRQVSDGELEKFCSARGWKYVTTSAKTGENVEQAFKDLGQSALVKVLGVQRPPVVASQ
jgi:small GTP-binding protein